MKRRYRFLCRLVPFIYAFIDADTGDVELIGVPTFWGVTRDPVPY